MLPKNLLISNNSIPHSISLWIESNAWVAPLCFLTFLSNSKEDIGSVRLTRSAYFCFDMHMTASPAMSWYGSIYGIFVVLFEMFSLYKFVKILISHVRVIVMLLGNLLVFWLRKLAWLQDVCRLTFIYKMFLLGCWTTLTVIRRLSFNLS